MIHSNNNLNFNSKEAIRDNNKINLSDSQREVSLELSKELKSTGIITKFLFHPIRKDLILQLNHKYRNNIVILSISSKDWIKYIEQSRKRLEQKGVENDPSNITKLPRSGVVTMYNNNCPDGIKFFYEDAKALKKLEDDLFEALISILDDLSNDYYKHEKLVITTFITTSSFPIYGYNIPDEINAKLNQLPEPVLHDFTNNLIDRLHKYFIQNEKLQTYQYFIGQIRDEWLLKWRFI